MAYGIGQYDFLRTDFKNIKELRGNLDGQDWPGIAPFADILFSLAVSLKAKLILEIGTGGLCSAQCFLHALDITGGKMISCDTVKRFKDFSHPKFHFINAPSYEIVKIWTQELDILFIDGDHQYEAIKRDYALFFPFVKQGGLIIFHDTNHPLSPGPGKAVKEIEGRKLVFEEFPGLTVFQKA